MFHVFFDEPINMGTLDQVLLLFDQIKYMKLNKGQNKGNEDELLFFW